MNNETLIIVLVAACLIVNLITMFVVISSYKNKTRSNVSEQLRSVKIAPVTENGSSSVQGIVFCRKCGKQFDSSLMECPHCKKAR